MKNVLGSLAVAGLFTITLAGCVSSPGDDNTVPAPEPIGETTQQLSAPGGDQCAPINDGLAALDDALQNAVLYAQIDFDANGATGAMRLPRSRTWPFCRRRKGGSIACERGSSRAAITTPT